MGRSRSGWTASVSKALKAAAGRLKAWGSAMRRRPLAVLAAAAALALAAGALHLALRASRSHAVLEAARPSWRHFDVVTVRLEARGLARAFWRRRPPSARVLLDGKPVATIGGLVEFPLAYDPVEDAWLGRWPVPWNAPAGPFLPELAGPIPPDAGLEVRAFRVTRRAPKPVRRGFVAADFESSMPLASMQVTAPDGLQKDWRGLLDWAEHFGADAFWMLAGVTPGGGKGDIWLEDNLSRIQAVGREAHRRGLKFGVWAMCYLTAKHGPPPARYRYAVEYEEGALKATRAISLADPKRPADVAEFLDRFARMPEVDFVGLDYIRNALGGVELAEDFFREMPGARLPAGWKGLPQAELRRRFAQKTASRKDKAFIDQWRWWRAHKAATIVSSIRAGVKADKPMWAFTLGWDKGWHHGQDPVMMTDAGVDVDAVMLYESDGPQFDGMMADWRGYLEQGDVQLIVADVIDWPLHQFTIDPSGPQEYARRMKAAVSGIHREGRVRGVFIHDLARLLWGRKGPYATEDWAAAVKESVAALRGAPSPRGAERSGAAPASAGPAGSPNGGHSLLDPALPAPLP